MAIEQFKQTLWSRQFIEHIDERFAYGAIATRRYEGEARFGNKVKILEIGDVTVSGYDGTALNWEAVKDLSQDLVIDQASSFSFKVDDVDKAQSVPGVMEAAMRNAAHKVADTIDAYMAGLYAQAGITDATNLGSSSSTLTVNANDILELFTYMSRYLNAADAPSMGRWVVLPPEAIQSLVYAQVVDAAGTPERPNDMAYDNGMVTRALGFDIYMSNNVSGSSGNYRCMFGSADALALVKQVDKIEAVRLQDHFADGVKGLAVYGAKVVRSDHLGTAYANFSTLTS